MFNNNVNKSKTITIVSVIGILILMAICGAQVNNHNKGEMQIPATEIMWESSQAGNYEQTDEITITLKGVDASGIQSSTLQPSDITVYLDGKEVNPTTKNVEVVQSNGDYASYNLTLSGFSDSGHLHFKIKSGTLTDKIGKTSPEIYVGTGINIKEPLSISSLTNSKYYMNESGLVGTMGGRTYNKKNMGDALIFGAYFVEEHLLLGNYVIVSDNRDYTECWCSYNSSDVRGGEKAFEVKKYGKTWYYAVIPYGWESFELDNEAITINTRGTYYQSSGEAVNEFLKICYELL